MKNSSKFQILYYMTEDIEINDFSKKRFIKQYGNPVNKDEVSRLLENLVLSTFPEYCGCSGCSGVDIKKLARTLIWGQYLCVPNPEKKSKEVLVIHLKEYTRLPKFTVHRETGYTCGSYDEREIISQVIEKTDGSVSVYTKNSFTVEHLRNALRFECDTSYSNDEIREGYNTLIQTGTCTIKAMSGPKIYNTFTLGWVV